MRATSWRRACRIARALADDGAWDEFTARHLELARRGGAFAALPVALTDRVLVELFSGRIGVAMSLAAESDAVVEATGSHLTLRTSIVLANWRGRDAEALALIEARRQDVLRRGEGLWLAANDWGSAIRCNGLGRYEDALAAAERAAEAARGLGPSILLLAELVEAAARGGQAERATGPLAQLAEIAHAAGTDWALGTHARAAAMLAEGEAAERLYREAIERLSHVKTRATLARARLLYGEWLRREHRRVDAREQLRVAYAMLSDMGMEAFAERARRELLATGETVRKRTVATLDELTPQEGTGPMTTRLVPWTAVPVSSGGRHLAPPTAQRVALPGRVTPHRCGHVLTMRLRRRKDVRRLADVGPGRGPPRRRVTSAASCAREVMSSLANTCAADALERLVETTQAGGTDFGLGIEARSRALVSEGDAATASYREGIDRLGRTQLRPELARAHLLYGEWLRREDRRADARVQLRTAHEMLAAMGAEAFAERARRELLATGETVRRRTLETVNELTAQEASIARLARDGRINPEIGAQLFLSARTVEWHLRTVFTSSGSARAGSCTERWRTSARAACRPSRASPEARSVPGDLATVDVQDLPRDVR